MQDHIHRRKMSRVLLSRTWGSDQTIRFNIQLNAARTENAVAKIPCLNPTGLYDPTKHKSILAVTYHLNRKQKTIFNANNSCPRTVPTEHGTITKHNLQRMNARPYPQKKDVDSIALNASLHPLEAPTKRFASTSNWMPLAQRTRLQNLHAWIPRDSMIQLNTNQSSLDKV